MKDGVCPDCTVQNIPLQRCWGPLQLGEAEKAACNPKKHPPKALTWPVGTGSLAAQHRVLPAGHHLSHFWAICTSIISIFKIL